MKGERGRGERGRGERGRGERGRGGVEGEMRAEKVFLKLSLKMNGFSAIGRI